MSTAVVAAGAAGAFAVGAAWDALRALEEARAVQAAAALVARLRATAALGSPPAASERRRLMLVGAATLLVGGWLLAGPVAGLVCAGAGPWAAARLLAVRERHWRRAVVAEAPAVARALADALSAGHSIRGAVAHAASSAGLPPAAAAEIRRCAAAIALGEPTDTALERLARRADDPGYDTLVAAVLLQRAAGGDLAGLLRDLAATVEAAAAAEADARAATAQARFTGGVVAAMPLAAGGIVALVDPAAIGALTSSPLSAWLLAAAAGCELLALAALRQLSGVGERR